MHLIFYFLSLTNSFIHSFTSVATESGWIWCLSQEHWARPEYTTVHSGPHTDINKLIHANFRDNLEGSVHLLECFWRWQEIVEPWGNQNEHRETEIWAQDWIWDLQTLIHNVQFNQKMAPCPNSRRVWVWYERKIKLLLYVAKNDSSVPVPQWQVLRSDPRSVVLSKAGRACINLIIYLFFSQGGALKHIPAVMLYCVHISV